jgi:hypothetical protein
MTRTPLTEFLELYDELYDLGAFGREKNVRARSRRDRLKRRTVAAMYRRARRQPGRRGGPIGGDGEDGRRPDGTIPDPLEASGKPP